jgi:hypothetical protein
LASENTSFPFLNPEQLPSLEYTLPLKLSQVETVSSLTISLSRGEEEGFSVRGGEEGKE